MTTLLKGERSTDKWIRVVRPSDIRPTVVWPTVASTTVKRPTFAAPTVVKC